VLLDQSLANMDEQRFQAALATKVEVSVRLAQVFEQEPLDFVLFFSSLNAFTRGAGQSNYAAGCTFEDAFAARLRQDWRCKIKVMNWGYWGNVGVVAEPAYRERMAQAGIGSLEPAEAMEALEHLLAGPVDQMVVLKTAQSVNPVRMLMPHGSQAMGGEIIQAKEVVTALEPKRLPSFIHSLYNYRVPLPKPPTKSIGVVTSEVDTSRLEEVIQKALRRTVAEVIKVKSEEIESDIALSEYGFDLAALAELTNRLNQTYHLQLAPTLFLEVSTLQQLAHYLVQRHQDAMRKHFKLVLDSDNMKNAHADINT
jgi:acyl carrier protein